MSTNEWFPMQDAVYLDCAARGVMPRVSLAAVERALALSTGTARLSDEDFFAVPARLRSAIAALIGASAHEIALTTGAGSGIEVIAQRLPLQRGDEVVIAAGDFPIQYAVWKPMEQRAGIALRIVRPRGRFLAADDLIEAITPRTRVVSVAHVRFDDASLLDARRVADACHAHGARFVLDVSQSCGSMPVDVRALGADALVCAGYKWLLSPYGTGFFWVQDDLLDELQHGPFTWTGQPADSFATLNFVDPKASRDAKRWDAAEAATRFNLNLAAMIAAVDLVLRLGPESVLRHNRQLIDSLFEKLPAHCAAASPLDANERGAFGCITAGDAAKTVETYERLRAANFVLSMRQGRIRIAPHLFNTQEQIRWLTEKL